MKWVFALLALTQAMHGKGKKKPNEAMSTKKPPKSLKAKTSQRDEDGSRESFTFSKPKKRANSQVKMPDRPREASKVAEPKSQSPVAKSVSQRQKKNVPETDRKNGKRKKPSTAAEDDGDENSEKSPAKTQTRKNPKTTVQSQSKPAPERKTSSKEDADAGDEDDHGDDDSESEEKDDGPKNTIDELDDANLSEIKRNVTAWFKVDDDLLKRLRSLTTSKAKNQVKAALGILENGKYITDAVNALLKFEEAKDKDVGIKEVMTSLTDSFVKSLRQVRQEVREKRPKKKFFSLERGYALAHSEPPKPVDSSFQQLDSILTERLNKVNQSLKVVRDSLKKKYAKLSGDDRADEDEYEDDDDDDDGDKDE